MSTDPAHSLGDALGIRLGPRVRRIRRGLDAVELDASRAFARWIAAHRSAAADVLEHGTWLDRDDIDALLDLPLPGIDELIGLIEIDRLAGQAEAPKPRTLVVDTAPTGHTLRLLAAPDAVRALAEMFDAMQAEHRLIREQLARVGRPEAADRLIAEIAGQAAGIAANLRDSHETRFVWVTLPEPMSLAESQDAIAALGRAGIHVGEVIVNRVLTDEGPCPICDHRRAEERAVLARIRRTIGRGRTVRTVDEKMAHGSGLMAHGHQRRGPTPRTSIGPEPSAISHMHLHGAKLLFVGGKGGVGKTTVAAAIALSLARANRARRVLLLSTDPAHSLGDVFGSPLSDRAVPVPRGPANLFAREVDAAAAFAARKSDFDAALAEIASSVGVQPAAADGASDLVDLAPPGIDELFGLLSVFDARADYDVIVVDTAPTGHALRLLELPDEARTWVQVLLRVLLKYRTLVRPGRLAAGLVDVSKSIREFQAMLRDREATRVLAVTRAAELPRVETARFLARLTRLRLYVPAVVVNALTPESGSCRRCRRTRAAEQREIAALRRVVGRRSIIPAPLAAPAPRGIRALESWARTWLA